MTAEPTEDGCRFHFSYNELNTRLFTGSGYPGNDGFNATFKFMEENPSATNSPSMMVVGVGPALRDDPNLSRLIPILKRNWTGVAGNSGSPLVMCSTRRIIAGHDCVLLGINSAVGITDAYDIFDAMISNIFLRNSNWFAY